MPLSRRAALASLTGALAGATSACNKGPKRRQIAVIPKGTSHVFWISVQSGAEAAGREFDVDILWNGPAAETEFSRQVQILDSMITRRVDGIAIAAGERKALVPGVERAVAAGIPVVVFDSGLDSEAYMSFIATNNNEGGALAARELASRIGNAGPIALLMHTPGSQSTMDREEGFEAAIRKEFPNINIIARQYGQSDRAKARAAAENFLAGNPNLKAIFASSEPSAVGAALAIKARGLEDKVTLIGFDASEPQIEDLRNGAIDALIVQDPVKMGHDAVQLIVDKLNGKTPPKRIDLSARVVRKEDMDQPEIQRLLAPPGLKKP